eukprot:TRINITY_DN79295_c0_g1_i1.p1 TRINITY_DN79295_c0_g1~~TRINITY_DN79295_c0_g1_i1.p1  ORF type:complete len:443 (+),score=66.20 TRINITY_DN79295_c0_g1_i1:48-1376(+)
MGCGSSAASGASGEALAPGRKNTPIKTFLKNPFQEPVLLAQTRRTDIMCFEEDPFDQKGQVHLQIWQVSSEGLEMRIRRVRPTWTEEVALEAQQHPDGRTYFSTTVSEEMQNEIDEMDQLSRPYAFKCDSALHATAQPGSAAEPIHTNISEDDGDPWPCLFDRCGFTHAPWSPGGFHYGMDACLASYAGSPGGCKLKLKEVLPGVGTPVPPLCIRILRYDTFKFLVLADEPNSAPGSHRSAFTKLQDEDLDGFYDEEPDNVKAFKEKLQNCPDSDLADLLLSHLIVVKPGQGLGRCKMPPLSFIKSRVEPHKMEHSLPISLCWSWMSDTRQGIQFKDKEGPVIKIISRPEGPPDLECGSLGGCLDDDGSHAAMCKIDADAETYAILCCDGTTINGTVELTGIDGWSIDDLIQATSLLFPVEVASTWEEAAKARPKKQATTDN